MFRIAAVLSLLFMPVITCLAQDSSIRAARDSGHTIPDTLLFSIQKAQSVITEINVASKKGTGTDKYHNLIKQITDNILPVKQDLSTPGKLPDNKILDNYRLLLTDAQARVSKSMNDLSAVSNNLQRHLDDIVSLSGDSMLMVTSGDTTSKRLYTEQLNNLKLQLQDAGKTATTKLDTVNSVLAQATALNLTITDLQGKVSEGMDASGAHLFSKEAPYLWNAPFTVSADHAADLLRSAYGGQNKILAYFLASTWDNRLLLFLITIAFFIWVFKNFRKLNSADCRDKTTPPATRVLKPRPVMGSLLILLAVTPLFEPDSPSIYIESTQFLVLFSITALLYRLVDNKQFRTWLIFAGSFVLLIVTYPMVNIAALPRLWLILLNGSFIYFGWKIRGYLSNERVQHRFIRPVNMIDLGLHVLSLIANLFGRVTLAKTLAITAVFSLSQIIALVMFIQLVTEALELQVCVSACTKGVFSRVDINRVRRSVRKILSWIAVIIWLIVFFTNLGISQSIYQLLDTLLSHTHKFGSVSFTLGKVFLFVFILYLASIAQNNIGLLFGETQLNVPGQAVVQKSSKRALVRLVIVIIGFLLAVAASGVSLTQLTIVLGALSVGIGLGMQNIVSNFVSGIILIFEKPFEIGDFVEIADKKGKIQDIGIRSSKMTTQLGSEVIIPNGDFLSNRLTNWTADNPYLKSEISFKVGIDTDMKRLSEMVASIVKQTDGSLRNIAPEVMISAVNADNFEVKVWIWITSIYTEPAFKSVFFASLINELKTNNIRLV